MNKQYEIALYDNFHTISTEEKFYKYLLQCYIDKYGVNFIKSIRICKNFKQFLYKKYPNLLNHTLAELCYWFYHDLVDFPTCENIKCNNKITKFYKFFDAYNRFCSIKCSNNSTSTKLARYKTCIIKYGKPNPNQFDSKIFKYRKYRQINVYNSFLNEEAIPLFSLDEYLNTNASNKNKIIFSWRCTKCNNEFKSKIKYCNNLINGQVHHARCLKCYPLYNFSGRTTSIREKEVVKYIKTIYCGKIIENDRSLMIPDKRYNNWKLNHELDIVLPDIKLAFEFNGTYWHNADVFPETVIDDNEKVRQCNKLGFTLFFINEHDWVNYSISTQKYISDIIQLAQRLN